MRLDMGVTLGFIRSTAVDSAQIMTVGYQFGCQRVVDLTVTCGR
jgi:hypothetical protein